MTSPSWESSSSLIGVSRLKGSRMVVRMLLAGLTAREREVVELRFGLLDDRPRTLDEVGQRVGLTPERVRQIQKITLARLGSFSEWRELRESLSS